MTGGLFSQYSGEQRFLLNALPPVGNTSEGARLQRLRVFRALNDELAGPGLKFAELAGKIGRAEAVEVYLQKLVEHGIRPVRTMGTTHD